MRGWVVVAAAIVAGCVRDGADPRVSSAPEMDLTVVDEVIRIGTVDGDPDQLLYNPRRPVFASDSVLSVTNALSEVRLYSVDGLLLRRFGRKGGGPGEFQAAYWHDYDEGVLVVVDEQTRALVFDADFREVRRVTLDPRLEINNAPGLLEGRRLVGLARGREAGAVGTNRYTRPEVDLWITDLESGESEVIDRVPGRGRWTTPDELGRTLPFGPVPTLAARGEWIAYSAGQDYRIQFYTTDGGQSAVELGVPRQRTDDRALSRWVEEMEQVFEDRGAPPSATVLPEYEPPLPDELPSWTKLFFDHSGCLWARRYQFPNSWDETWDVVRTDGRWVTTVELPRRFQLNDVRGSSALGLTNDDLGVAYVSLLELSDAIDCRAGADR